MSQDAGTLVLDQLIDPFSRCLDAESALRVIRFQIDPAIQTRVKEWAERANEGLLTEEERAQYEAVVNAADFIAILKAKARSIIESNGSV